MGNNSVGAGIFESKLSPGDLLQNVDVELIS